MDAIPPPLPEFSGKEVRKFQLSRELPWLISYIKSDASSNVTDRTANHIKTVTKKGIHEEEKQKRLCVFTIGLSSFELHPFLKTTQ